MQDRPAAISGRATAGQLFAYPFRIFFVSVGIWAVLVIPLWLAVFSGWIALPLALPPLYWHQHELLFGFLHAAIAGFLLTAVCVWTQTERMHGWPLLLLWLVWLAGRVLMGAGAGLPTWLVEGVSLAFLPLVMLDAGQRIWRARQQRQLVILVVLALLWLTQLGFLLAPAGPFAAGSLLAAIALMLTIGGRITPNFSAAWLRGQGEDPEAVRMNPWLERITLGSVALLLLAVLLDVTRAVAVLGVIAAVASALRLWLWSGWRVRSEPLLWILHLSLLWIPVALLLLATAALGWTAPTAWTHAAGAGAMGGLILGVISRVSLGHTGRALSLPRGMVTAFAFVHLAALLRVVTGLVPIPALPGLTLSAALWMLAFAIFLWHYIPILAWPRIDGRPG